MPAAKNVTPIEEKRNFVCPPGRLKLMEVAHNMWSVHAPDGTIPADVAKSDFWSLISEKLRPFDKFEVLAEDGTWCVEGRVLSCGRNWAQIFVKEVINFGTPVEPAKSERFEVKWKGPEKEWCVIRNDGAIIHEKIGTKELANQMLAEHEKKVG